MNLTRDTSTGTAAFPSPRCGQGGINGAMLGLYLLRRQCYYAGQSVIFHCEVLAELALDYPLPKLIFEHE